MRIDVHTDVLQALEIIKYFSIKKRVKEHIILSFTHIFDDKLYSIDSALSEVKRDNKSVRNALDALIQLNKNYSDSYEYYQELERIIDLFKEWVRNNSDYIDTFLLESYLDCENSNV
jgi:hypothetical protein